MKMYSSTCEQPLKIRAVRSARLNTIIPSLYIRNFQTPVSLCFCTGRFVFTWSDAPSPKTVFYDGAELIDFLTT